VVVVVRGDEINNVNAVEDKCTLVEQDMKTAASMLAPPPSPPRKLLDGPKTRKKKKKKAQPDADVVAVKSSLSSFLQSLQPSSRK
ncbi:hypothetical protein BBJ28_00007037, partial [Nothophytophthora sp. Chile5]